jgi:hypothetical protein
MHADEAKKLYEAAQHETKVFEIKVSPNLWNRIMNRIERAARGGRRETTLSSINDDGIGVRGIGTYLSPKVRDDLIEMLQDQGYTVSFNTINMDYNRELIYVRW